MWNEYEITYRKAFELKSDDFNDKSSIRENIARIRREMKSLGDVNINSEVEKVLLNLRKPMIFLMQELTLFPSHQERSFRI